MPQSSEIAPLLVVPPSDVPLPERPPPRELAKPEDDVHIDVVRYVVADDAPAALRAALPKITERYVGKDRSFEDLVNAAGEVTRFLQRDLGFYLGYAYLPEQTPTDGVIRIAVLEGRLDKVVLNWTDGLPVDRDVVEAYLARLQPGSILRVRDVERVVFLVNDLRGITARFEVRAGSTPGTAQLVVTPRAESVWTGKVDFDANGSRFMGVYEIGGLVQMASPSAAATASPPTRLACRRPAASRSRSSAGYIDADRQRRHQARRVAVGRALPTRQGHLPARPQRHRADAQRLRALSRRPFAQP